MMMGKSSPMKNIWKFFSPGEKAAFIILFVLTLSVSIAIPAILPNSTLQNIRLQKNYRAGELSDEDVISPVTVSFVDEIATETKREKAAKAVLPYFSFDLTGTMSALTECNEYRNAIYGKSRLTPDEVLRKYGIVDGKHISERIEKLLPNEKSIVAPLMIEGLRHVLSTGLFASADIALVDYDNYTILDAEMPRNDFSPILSNVYTGDILVDTDLFEYLLEYGLEKYPSIGYEKIHLIADAVCLFAEPNVRYDLVKTREMRQSQADNAGSVMIRVEKGDRIISKDTVITEQQLRIIDNINEIKVETPVTTVLSQTLFFLMILSLATYFIIESIPRKYRVPLYVIIYLAGVLLSITSAYFIQQYVSHSEAMVSVDVLLPFLIMPVLMTFITTKRRIGFATGFVLAGFAVLLPSNGKYAFFHILVIIEASVMFIRFGTTRLDIIYEALYSAVVAACSTLIFGMLAGVTLKVVFTNVLVTVINVSVTYVIVSIILPLFERWFNIPTTFRLQELCYTDSPTLNRLNQVAQGTFAHSRNVSDMAYNAAKEIGANAILARAGALYHDIGKSEHPEYFIENQSGKNAHDLIKNNLSAAIIKSHVRLGVEKGREIGLPQEVLDIIAEHHGNDIISFFYNAAKKDAMGQRNTLVSEEDFRYNGTIPQTPESGIVMLADCVEAASRTLKNPNTQKYDRLIMSIIISKINYNQLSESDLTLTDLIRIKDSFIKILIGRDHHRIEYDKD